jgi:ADP-heptose:LPS heptosyltransferase
MVLYQPLDKPVAQKITEPFPEVLLSPETNTFDQFAALVQKLWILITPDTSAVHLAAAFSIPSVVMYVQSNKELRIWEPYGSLSETVVTDIDDLGQISQTEVFNAVDRLIRQIGLTSVHTQHVAPPTA